MRSNPKLDRLVLEVLLAHTEGQENIGVDLWRESGSRGEFQRNIKETIRRIESEGWRHIHTE